MVGKEAFFARKAFVVTTGLLQKLLHLEVEMLTEEDQEMAIRFVRSLYIFQEKEKAVSSFIALPRCVSAFPRLKRLNFMFGLQGRDEEMIGNYTVKRMLPEVPLRLIRLLRFDWVPRG